MKSGVLQIKKKKSSRHIVSVMHCITCQIFTEVELALEKKHEVSVSDVYPLVELNKRMLANKEKYHHSGCFVTKLGKGGGGDRMEEGERSKKFNTIQYGSSSVPFSSVPWPI